MESTEPIGQQPPPSESVISQVPPSPPKSNKKNWIVAGTVILVAVLLGLAYVWWQMVFSVKLLSTSVKPLPSVSPVKLKSPKPTDIPSSTPAALPNWFVSYASLSADTSAKTETFVDPVLKTSFSYPSGYFMDTEKAVESDAYKMANVFFADTAHTDTIKAIKDLIQCDLDNRKEPAGVCRESQLNDVEVDISSYKQGSVDFSPRNRGCVKEIDTAEKVLLSCAGQMSIDPKDKGMSYTLYFLKGNLIQVAISVREPKKYEGLIKTILSSATNSTSK